MADNVKLSLSCVSAEFGDDRDQLRRALTRPNVEIKIQEDFQNRGGDTLAMLEDYIESCDVVVHLAAEIASVYRLPLEGNEEIRLDSRTCSWMVRVRRNPPCQPNPESR